MKEISSDIFKRIRRIQFATTRLVQDMLGGAYRAAFKGNGMEFEEVREYFPGDDVRSIDWNVTARMNTPYVKTFREERELTVMLLVDVSASLRFGSTNRMKSDLMTEVAAVLALSAIHNQDKVGLILFSGQVEKYIPPKKGLRHVLRVIREVLAFEPQYKGTDISGALSYFRKVRKRTCVCFLMSDFLTSQDDSQAIKLTAKSHDLIAIQVRDPKESTFPNLDLASVKDLETGETAWIDTSSSDLQTSYVNQTKQKHEQLKFLMNKVGSGFLVLNTDKPYSADIRKYFEQREKRRS